MTLGKSEISSGISFFIYNNKTNINFYNLE